MEKKTEKLPGSWKSGSYQKAIARARRRLAGKEKGEITPQESIALKQQLLPLTKPDYSRWAKIDADKKLKTLHSKSAVSSKHEPLNRLPQNSAHEFLSLADQAHLHPTVSPLGQSESGISMTYDDFGLCSGCFHQKGPHHHYMAPVRVGGGYSIYQRQRARWLGLDENQVTWDTVRWLSDLGKSPKDKTNGISFGDEYSVELFKQFINNGGDVASLKEYLESNFNSTVLTELKESGVNVQLITEYAEMYRQHVKRILHENKKKQSDLTKRLAHKVDLATLYTAIESEGVNMGMLIKYLTGGRNDSDVTDFEARGGNIEILEHYVEQINQEPLCDIIIKNFQEQWTKDNEIRMSEIFLEFVRNGGDLATLKKFAAGDKYLLGAEDDLMLIEACMGEFTNQETLLKHLETFLTKFHHQFASANLLQEYIENGGRVSQLKSYVKEEKEKTHKTAGNRLLHKIGDVFRHDPTLRSDLENFPDDPEIIEAYVINGGSFPKLVQAVSDVLDKPKLESYVKSRTNEVFCKFAFRDRSKTKKDSKRPSSAPDRLSRVLLPTLLGKARADLVYDELVEADQSLMKNEGRCLSLAINLEHMTTNHLTDVKISERQLVTRLVRRLSASDVSSLSPITGKRRHTLWIPPPPFEIKKSTTQLTLPQSPFTSNRIYQIPSLSEEYILDVEKRQRQELDILKRTFMLEQFQKSWKLAITSPRGSIISADYQQSDQLPINVTSQQITKALKPLKKDKKSRRERHREKMKAVKHEGHVSRRESPSGRSSRSSTSLLMVPTAEELEDKKAIPVITLNHGEMVDFPELETADKTELEPETVLQVEKDEEEVAGNTAPTIKIEINLSTAKTENIPRISLNEATKIKVEENKAFTKVVPKTTFATAFGPKLASSSYSNFMTLKNLQKMKENPETLVEKLSVREQLSSKSESNLSKLVTPAQSKTWDEISKEILLRKNSRTRRKSSVSTVSETEDIIEKKPAKMVDLLKQYCIIREDRLPAYRRVFDKYVIIKSMRDRERRLEKKRENKPTTEASQEDGESSAEYLLEKNMFVLEKLQEQIVELQEKIKVAKCKWSVKAFCYFSCSLSSYMSVYLYISLSVNNMSIFPVEVNRAVAIAARANYSDVIKTKKSPPSGKTSSVFGIKSPEARTEKRRNSDEDILQHLSASMRQKCEAQMEVRDRKVVLEHLRGRTKRLLSRQKTIEESSKKLIKEMEKEKINRGIKSRNMEPFTRKQSAIYRELHPTSEEFIDVSDLKDALREIGAKLRFFDESQFTEGIRDEGKLTFRAFCVVAALNERKKDLHKEGDATLAAKLKACKDHYSSLLGPDLETLQSDLAAVGIPRLQREEIIKKLSRGNSGRLDFLDFVTYAPLFVNIHQTIVKNPFPIVQST
uniref:uncharacterized protein LOC100182831 isoform X2 n=1 Tax=Ciona intestinalis TaxID=7719 RepID=UPI000EF48980|nr:uncharacterized protein LOC100182831 isoform X2 [Ciona intestinalis]|eukprot:XP_026695773.1 uncharacterized protein LOC100182831 isoform X2 [Ciona intestinalis]